MKTLFLITARGGSKGIPGKNIKVLGGKPLITYSIDIARQFTTDDCICVSTDSDEIIETVENCGLKIPFKRPAELATDTASSYDVIMHAINWYKNKNIYFDNVLLLQPTSPFRLTSHIKDALSLYDAQTDMVVSVKKVKSNISATYFRDTENGTISKVFNTNDNLNRRQDSETVYEINGSVYVMNVASLEKSLISNFKTVKKIVMDDVHSVDIDEAIDWDWAEFILEKKLVNLI